MNEQVKTFLDGVFAGEEIDKIPSLLECAGTLWNWQRDGVELPEGIDEMDVQEYMRVAMEEVKKAKELNQPLKIFRVDVSETLTASFFVEAHNANEAEKIFEAFEVGDGAFDIHDRLVDGSLGYEADYPILARTDETPDIPYAEAVELGMV